MSNYIDDTFVFEVNDWCRVFSFVHPSLIRPQSPDAPRRGNEGSGEEEDHDLDPSAEYSVTESSYTSVFGPAGFTLRFGK
jgi:hypothetical protein